MTTGSVKSADEEAMWTTFVVFRRLVSGPSVIVFFDHLVVWPFGHLFVLVVFAELGGLVLGSFSHMVVWSFSNLGILSVGRVVVWSFGHLVVWQFGSLVVWSCGRLIIGPIM